MRNKDIAIASIVTASIAGAVAARFLAAQQPANPRQQPGQRPPSGSTLKSGSPNFTSHRSTTYGQQTLEPKHVKLDTILRYGNITLTVLLRTEYGTP